VDDNVKVPVPVKVGVFVGVPVRLCVAVAVFSGVGVYVGVSTPPSRRKLMSSTCISSTPAPVLAHCRAIISFFVNEAGSPKPLWLKEASSSGTVTFVQEEGAVNVTPK